MPRGQLCELHVHFAGCLRAEHVLDPMADGSFDWSPYEDRYELAYGEYPRIRDLLRNHRIGEDVREEFKRLFVFDASDSGNFDRFQAKYSLLAAGSHFSDAELQHRLTQDFVDEISKDMAAIAADCRAHDIGHCEIRIMLGAHRPERIRIAMLTRLLELCRDNSDDDLTVRLTPSVPRGDALANWPSLRDLALGELGEWIVGVDFCHVEEGHPPRQEQAFADTLHAFNEEHPERALALLYHVGESFRDKSLESAIRWCEEAACSLRAHRLGHCIALGIDPDHFAEHERHERVDERRAQIAYDLAHFDALVAAGVPLTRDALEREAAELAELPDDQTLAVLYDRARLDALRARQRLACAAVRDSGAIVEICPTSNERIAGLTDREHHQLFRLHAENVPFVVSADDPGLLDITLAAEIDWVSKGSGIASDELNQRAWQARSEILSGRAAALHQGA